MQVAYLHLARWDVFQEMRRVDFLRRFIGERPREAEKIRCIRLCSTRSILVPNSVDRQSAGRLIRPDRANALDDGKLALRKAGRRERLKGGNVPDRRHRAGSAGR